MSFKREEISYVVGQRIKKFRTERKISQEALALSSEIYPAYLGRLERGERCPTIETVYKICGGLKISMSDLLDFDVDVKPTSEEAKHRIEKAMSGLSDEEAIRIAEIIENVVKFKTY
ncbi:MAG: helix-turn-helix transcriptional regulator [Ruminococcaceae bacterium]|nr:helix-turn-helix transcriptional regulator [Oscillospiraceae bacterium]